MLKTVLAVTLLATSISTFAANSPITVQSRGIYIGNNANLPAWQLTLTSVDNDITVQSFTLNRGNCVISYPGRGKGVNKRLQYGQSLSFSTPSNSGFTQCRPLELTVQTNKGAFTFNWQ